MYTQSVAVSGTVGKQVFATTKPVLLKGFLLAPISANANVIIRDGDASGTIVFQQSALANSSNPVLLPESMRFDKGMHVKVIGANAVCYLYID